MKKILMFSLILLFISGCKVQSGYSCIDGDCRADTENAQYLSLSDCKSDCGTNSGVKAGFVCRDGDCYPAQTNAQYSTLSACQQSACAKEPGFVQITASWNTKYNNCNSAFTVIIGLGYTSTDVTNEAFFAKSGGMISSPGTYSKNYLAPGKYYYKASKTFNKSVCGSYQTPPAVVTKNGSFTITAGKTTNISIDL